MNKILSIMFLVVFAFSCGGSSGGDPASLIETGTGVTATDGDNSGDGSILSPDGDADSAVSAVDSVNDVVREDGSLSGVMPVDFEITVLNMDGEPLNSAIVSFIDDTGTVVTSAVSNEEGLVQFTSVVETGDSAATISIVHQDYTAREIEVNDIGSLEAVIRTVGLEVSERPVEWIDSDGDGVPDEFDAFPADSELAFVSQGKFTLAFAAGVPVNSGGDFIVKLHITEKINVKNEVIGITLHMIPVDSDKSEQNLFGVRIEGESYMLVRDLKTGSDKPVMLNISLGEPVPRTDMPAMPYEPFVKPAADF